MATQDQTRHHFQVPRLAEIYGYVESPADPTDGSLGEGEDHDIYRGEAPARPPSASPSSSASSSSSSSVFGGRLGAISAGLEHAISRWARAWISTSSLPSSASSSSVSVVAQTKSQAARRPRRRPRSVATSIHNERFEREIAARVRAREDLRAIPRGFVLYAPKRRIVHPGAKSQASAERRAQRAAQDPLMRTTSLNEVTARLNVVLKERAKARRVQADSSGSYPGSDVTSAIAGALGTSSAPSRPLSSHQDYMLSDVADVARSSARLPLRKEEKGKAKAQSEQVPQSRGVVSSLNPPPTKLKAQCVPKAWWLDVASPTWDDICAIGKLLHLHPLTLEDILMQDPREKLEMFPKLGYYFLSFRAIESQKTRERLRHLIDEDVVNAIDESIVGEVNVYLVVFNEGICSFHFADIEEHVDRVRHRLMLLGDTASTSSEWIAHGLMDSIVDAFFPYLEIIEKEVAEIEQLVFSVGDSSGWFKDLDTIVSEEQSSETALNEKATPTNQDEKRSHDLARTSSIVPKPRFSVPTSFPLLFRRARRTIRDRIASIPRFKSVDIQAPDYRRPTTTVHRMARIRRLVTSLTRFLAVKSEVVAQVRKRLLTHGEWSLGTGTEDDLDIFVYIGDVQDHILTLQQALAHYERMLSQSHPTYLSQLRMAVSKAKSGSDKAVVSLTVVSLGVVCVQTLIGLVSMNCEVPANDFMGNQYNVFAVVIALAVVIVVIYGCTVRYWWNQAKRRRLKF